MFPIKQMSPQSEASVGMVLLKWMDAQLNKMLFELETLRSYLLLSFTWQAAKPDQHNKIS
jgi:hypothetical protein